MPAKPDTKEIFDPFIQRIADAVWAKAPIKSEFLKTAAPKAPPNLEPAPPIPPPIKPVAGRSETIDEYCARKRISRATYYKLKRQGIGPPEERFGAAVRIPPETKTA